MLKIVPSDSQVHTLTSISDLNDWLVLDDEVCKPSTSSCINLSNSLNNNLCIVFLWYGKIVISNNNNNNNNNNMAFKKGNPQNMPY